MAAVIRLNGPPLKQSDRVTARSTYAALSFGSLIESIKGAVQLVFSTMIAFCCCYTSRKWNERMIDSIQHTLLFAIFFPVFLTGIITPKSIDRVIS